MNLYLPFPTENLKLGTLSSARAGTHVFEQQDVEAVNAALAAGRPLLIRGEPGVGKSQLARAAAVKLGRAFVSEVIDARTEGRDLLWTFDAVRRLADAQMAGARSRSDESGEQLPDEGHYVVPGPLWWAFNWSNAEAQAERAGEAAPPVPESCDPKNGVVLLLDEIDKADSS
ncbi:MAG: AAA family ATPase, partial [Acidobacteriota bacterium]|nr:AAA family ATPase [Acidobacteriota bacterium]